MRHLVQEHAIFSRRVCFKCERNDIKPIRLSKLGYTPPPIGILTIWERPILCRKVEECYCTSFLPLLIHLFVFFPRDLVKFRLLSLSNHLSMDQMLLWGHGDVTACQAYQKLDQMSVSMDALKSSHDSQAIITANNNSQRGLSVICGVSKTGSEGIRMSWFAVSTKAFCTIWTYKNKLMNVSLVQRHSQTTLNKAARIR